MTKSMTGFARVQEETEFGAISIEIKTVNSRYLDTYFKIPDTLKPIENSIRTILAKKLTRGKVECFIRWTKPTSDKYQINSEMLEDILDKSNNLSSNYGLQQIDVGSLFSLPGIFSENKNSYAGLDEKVLALINMNIDELVLQRIAEGSYLESIIIDRLEKIKLIVKEINIDYQESVEKIKEKLYTKLAEVTEKLSLQVDESRFEQEMIYLMQKMDIEEELDRLNGHIKEVEKLLKLDTPIGRKLDFLMQEMNRETNTIASKSNNLGVTMNSVELKVLLEQIREQVQNIE